MKDLIRSNQLCFRIRTALLHLKIRTALLLCLLMCLLAIASTMDYNDALVDYCHQDPTLMGCDDPYYR